MKKILGKSFKKIILPLLLVISIFTAYSDAEAARIAAWDFTGEGTVSTVTTSSADVFDSSIASAPVLTRGSGAAWSTGTSSFRTQGFQNNGISISNTDYFQFTIAVPSGKTLSLSTIDAKFAGTSTFYANAGVSNQFAYSIDGTNFVLIGSPQIQTSTSLTLTQISLSGITALQNIPASTTVTIRYYASGQTTTGGWGFNSSASGNYGLDIGGTISASSSPTITLNPVTPILTAFATTAGTASPAQTFAVTGSNLTADVLVSAPTGFEVSQDGGTSFESNQTLARSGTTLASKTISVRIAASAAAGSLASANVTLTSTGATTANVAVSGTVAQAGVAPTVTAATIPGTFGVALSANVVASQNPTSYAVSSGTLPAGLSLDLSTGAITGTPAAAGTGVVVAVTASNTTGTSAPANLTFDIAKGGQTISGLSTADSKYTTAPSYNLTATASSGLAVTYTSSNEAVATVSGSTVTIVGPGTTTLTASQGGDNNYNAATSLTQTLTVVLPPMIAWEMTGQSNGGSSPMVPTTLDNRVVVEGLTKGSGIGAVTTGNVWGGNDFMGTDLTTAIANNDFATFSVTPASGYQVSFSQIPAYNIRRSGTGPTTGIWQYRKGSGAFADIGSSITWGAVTSGNYNPQPAIDLSGIAVLQNVPSGTTVTFRVVTWGGTGTAGTWYINTITGNDLAVVGTISEYTAVVPSLSSFTPAFGPSGSTVTISGSNLSAVTGVKFNGQSATFAYQSSDQTIAATVPAGLRAGKISLVYGSPAAEVLSTSNFEPLDGSGLATVVNGDGASPYVNTAIFAKGQSNNQTLAVTVSNPILNSAISKVRITLPSDFSQPNSANCLLNGAGTVSVSGRALTIDGAVITSNSPLTVTISGLSTPDTSVSTALDGNYGINVETAGAGGTLAIVLVAPTAYVLVPIINLRGVDSNGVPTQIGKKVAFEGVVTASGLGSTAGRTKAYVQDASAAVYIYSAAFPSAPIQGNVYAALGTLTQFRGGTQIDPGTSANLIDRGAGVLPEPTVLTLPISTTVGERYEGSLVKVVGLSRATGEVDLWATSATITLQDSAAATVDIFLQPDSKNNDVNSTTEPSNYPATVVGILGQYVQASPFTTGYQLQPRTQADLIVAPSGLSYANISGTVGTPISNVNPAVTGIVDSYSISPALPAGLSLNTATGVISGTPTIAAASAIYTVTATNAGGNTTTTVSVTVNPAGSTFAGAYPGKSPTDIAPNGLSYLANYGFGGSEGIAPTLPIMDSSDATNLKLIVVFRTDDSSISLGGQTSTDLALAGSWSASGVSVDPSTDASPVPANTARKVISVVRSGSKRFLRATITK